MKIKFNKFIWSYPILMGLMTLGMNYSKEGTDLVGQVYSLSFIDNDSPVDLILDVTSRFHGCYYGVYAMLHQFIGIQPIQYIAIIAFAFFLTFVLSVRSWLRINEVHLSNGNINVLVIISLFSFSPIYVCVTRNLFAITLLLIGYLFLLRKKYLLVIPIVVASLNAHEGMKLIYAIFIVAYGLRCFCLPIFKDIQKRNICIIIIGIALLLIGPTLFSIAGNYMVTNEMVSEKYDELYVSTGSGDGAYKYVIILSMLGSLLLIAPSLISTTQSIASDIVYAENKVRYTASAIFVTSIIGLWGCFLIAQYFGAIGCALSTCLSLFVYLIYVNVFYKVKLGLDIKSFFINCHISITVRMMMSLIIGFIIGMIFPINSWGDLLVAAVIYSIVFLINAYIIAFNNEEKSMIKTIIRR